MASESVFDVRATVIDEYIVIVRVIKSSSSGGGWVIDQRGGCLQICHGYQITREC